MQARKLLHTLFSNTLAFIHAKRLTSLLDAVEALLIGKKLSLTGLARNISSFAKERNCIRKMDRLLGNTNLHHEIASCYQSHCIMLIKNNPKPTLSIDWAATDKRKDWHILRASLNIKGRGFVLYQEVHPIKKLNSTKVQNRFLDKLKSILPINCKPIIVTDAGFRFSWFKKVKKLGFDFIGRVRNKTAYRMPDSENWYPDCIDLYKKATKKPEHLGKLVFGKEHNFECSVILYKTKNKKRKHLNRSGNPTNDNASNRCARRQRDPWLLVTSLDMRLNKPQRITGIYSKRMQIEEDFRDTKSHRYGFGLRYSMSKNAKRIEVLLLIAALATLICWLVSLVAKKNNAHLDYQSNSIKSRNVLSVIYLGCQMIRRGVKFTYKEIKAAYYELTMEAALC